jgi:hypothetical protein
MLTQYGLRPDQNVGFYIAAPAAGAGYVAYAVSINPGTTVYVYDGVNSSGVAPWDGTANYADGAGFVVANVESHRWEKGALKTATTKGVVSLMTDPPNQVKAVTTKTAW